jgi:hypothetical protein
MRECAVYEEEYLSLRSKVAVKEALVYEASLRRAFEKEAQRLARLRHPALRSDLYSLAATLYTLLTNAAPEEPSVRQRVMAHQSCARSAAPRQ